MQRAPIHALEDFVAWFDAVMDGLAIERAHVVGASYGGLLTVLWASRSPRHVATASLVDPAGLDAFNLPKFMLWGTALFLGASSPAPVKRWVARRLRMALILDRPMMRLARLSLRRFRSRIPGGAVKLGDDVLRSIAVPTLVLLGERSIILDADRVATRCRTLMPDVSVEIVSDGSHGLPVDNADFVAARIRSFLDATPQ